MSGEGREGREVGWWGGEREGREGGRGEREGREGGREVGRWGVGERWGDGEWGVREREGGGVLGLGEERLWGRECICEGAKIIHDLWNYCMQNVRVFSAQQSVHVHVGTGTYRLYMYMYIGIVHVLYVYSLQNHYIMSLHVQVYQYTMCIMYSVHVPKTACTCTI